LGSYKVPPNTNMLSALAGMYLNNQGELANKILNAIYPSQNVGLYINNTYAPSLKTPYFNGNGYILTNAKEFTTNMTLCAWIYQTSLPATGIESVEPVSCNNGNGAFELYPNTLIWWACGSAEVKGTPIAVDRWYFICGTYNSSKSALYLNGALVNDSTSNTSTLSFSQIKIGDGYNVQSGGNLFQYYFSGRVINLQIYNLTLSQNKIAYLYDEGIYGTPISYGLLDWWPLLGNANDYGPNNFEPLTSNVNYNSSNILPLTLANAYLVSKASTPLSVNVNGTSRIYNVSVVVWR